MKDNLIRTLSILNIKISLIFDIYTVSIDSIFFISVTAHYINNNWQSNKHILAFCSFKYLHFDRQIFNTIYQTVAIYGISNKIISIIFDNASNNNVDVQLLNDSFYPILNENLFLIRCACHILNLSVQDGMGIIQNIIIIIKNAVYFIQSSRAWLQEFKQLYLDHGKYFKKFKLNVVIH